MNLSPEASGFEGIDSAFGIALHMHQPLIPAGGPDLHNAELIGNLQWMLANPEIGDNHNASVFRWCYKRMAEFVPQLLDEGKAPRVMLEYSGTLLWGLRQMGADDVIDVLKYLTTDARCRRAVEWLGCPWGHAVAPSTPVQDYRLHVRAWQHHFAAIFGLEALGRVRGFSPSEMALPNHPDVAYEFVKTISDCGYRWVLVQEHTVEGPDGAPLRSPHLPHRLVCTNSRGEHGEHRCRHQDTGERHQTRRADAAVLRSQRALPAHARLPTSPSAGHPDRRRRERRRDDERVPAQIRRSDPRVLRIADPGHERHRVPRTARLGRRARERPLADPARVPVPHLGRNGAAATGRIDSPRSSSSCAATTDAFTWRGGAGPAMCRGCAATKTLLAPMDEASSLFHEHLLARRVPADEPRYRKALFHLLAAETSCYRYWGEGIWTEYGREISRRAIEAAKA